MAAVVGSRFQLPRGCQPFVGEVIVEVQLENSFDAHLARIGQLADADVRRRTVQALVDTGATDLVLPEDLVQALGLDFVESLVVEYADGRRSRRPVAGPVTLGAMGRRRHFDCVCGPAGTHILLGQVVLESLDLLVDCKAQRLLPRPESPDIALHRG